MLGRYRLTGPIMAMFAVDGHHDSTTVPEGALVDLNGKKFNGDRLMEVLWDERLVLMFTEDLRNRTVLL